MAENKKRLKINGSLPNNIVKIANVDKKDHETWYPNRNICDFPFPVRISILGKVGMGKSTLAKNIFLRSQIGKVPYKELIIIHGSASSKEWDEMEPTMILNDIPDPRDLEENTKKTMIIIDDFEFEKLPKESLKRLSSIFRYVSSHHNFSIILCYQSFFDMPAIIKKCTNVFIIYRPNNNDELGTIARRVGMKKDDMFEIFDNMLTDKRDNLCIDMTENSPAPLRKNLFQPIQYNDPSKDKRTKEKKGARRTVDECHPDDGKYDSELDE